MLYSMTLSLKLMYEKYFIGLKILHCVFFHMNYNLHNIKHFFRKLYIYIAYSTYIIMYLYKYNYKITLDT